MDERQRFVRRTMSGVSWSAAGAGAVVTVVTAILTVEAITNGDDAASAMRVGATLGFHVALGLTPVFLAVGLAAGLTWAWVAAAGDS
ncbi:hypothetical protein ACQP2E_22755 [Actinoplanes sp. CA-015351]|uniref:hypothetical protein n=1 Tax=Actinoplanes sp. CA-015351 TaxID=3239897 RepID=UPI003D971701